MPANWKINEVEELKELIKNSAVIGIADASSLNAVQFQSLRRDANKNNVKIRAARKPLISRALSNASTEGVEGIDKLTPDGNVVCLIFSSDSPFQLFKFIEGSKTQRAAKPGERALEDIVVEAGETDFKPGPIAAELQRAGIPAVIDKGKVKIKTSKVVVKADDVIGKELAGALGKLEIFPFTSSLDLRSVYDFKDKIVFTRELLAIDSVQTAEDLANCVRDSIGLGLGLEWVNSVTIEPLLGTAIKNALNIGIECNIYNEKTLPFLLNVAHQNALKLST